MSRPSQNNLAIILKPKKDVLHLRASCGSPDKMTAPDIANALSVVEHYMPDLDFALPSDSALSTTIISAYFPPPPNEPLVRKMGNEPFTRDTKAHIEGLKLMLATCSNLVLFLPPGDLAKGIREAKKPSIVVYDHYPSV